MKLLTALRALLAPCLVAVATAGTAAPTLIVTNGILMGAKDVDVEGTLYNVTFEQGSCNSLYNGCKSMVFTNAQAAVSAGQALLAQVLTNGPIGNFDTSPGPFGCSWREMCQTAIPYALDFNYPYLSLHALVLNNYGPNTDPDVVYLSSYNVAADLTGNPYANYAVFALSDSVKTVPEPASIALLGLSLAGMLALRKLRVIH